MYILIYVVCFIPALILQSIISNSGIISSFVLSFAGDVSYESAGLAGLISAVVTVAIYGTSLFIARKWSRNYAAKEFAKDAAAADMSIFEYAKSIAPEAIVEYCDAQKGKPFYVVTSYLDDQMKAKVISRACCDALTDGYTKIMQDGAPKN